MLDKMRGFPLALSLTVCTVFVWRAFFSLCPAVPQLSICPQGPVQCALLLLSPLGTYDDASWWPVHTSVGSWHQQSKILHV